MIADSNPLHKDTLFFFLPTKLDLDCALQPASMAPSKHQMDLSVLYTTLASTRSLIATFQTTISSPSSNTSSSTLDAPNALRLLHDASTLLKAQITKLSLLMINKPFTPSAITTIITSITSECLPALVSAFELCRPAQCTNLLHEHLKQSIVRLLREIDALLQTIPAIEEQPFDEKEGRTTLANTGVVWEICDALISIASNGLVNVAAQKAEAFHSLLKDAIAELEDWDPDDEEEDGLLTSETSSSDHASDGELREGASPPLETAVRGMTLTPPPTPSPLRRLLTDTLANLRLIRLLYPALRKRRVLTFPNISASSALEELPDTAQLIRFDALLRQLGGFSEHADELAGGLYAHDEDEVVDRLRLTRASCKECVNAMRLDWSGKEDEFTAWSKKWNDRFDQGSTEGHLTAS